MLKILSVAALFLVLARPAVPLDAGKAARNTDPAHREIASDDLIDINHAGLDQLLHVPGLTRPWAERVIRFRPYGSKLDLFRDGVLPSDIYSRIKPYIIARHDKKQ